MSDAPQSDAQNMVDALVRTRRTGLAATAALGGLALVVGLAAKALRNAPEAKDASTAPAPSSAVEPAGATPFDHVTVGEDEARTMLRAMAAAGIGDDGRRWLETELTDPADVDDIAERVTTPEQAARIYTAARLAIDPDTLQERTFLKDLADALDLPGDAVARLETELAA